MGADQAQPKTSVSARLSLGYGLLRCNQGQLDEGIRFCEAGLQGQLSFIETSWGQTRLAWILILRGDFNRAIRLLKEALETFRAISDMQGSATTLSQLGRAYWQLGRWSEAFQCHLESGVLAQQMGDLQLEALHYRHIGLIQWNRGEWLSSIKNHFLALKLYELIGDSRGIGASLENIGAVYSDAGQFRTALWYLFQAENVLLSCKATDFCSYAHLFMARAFAGIGDLDSSFTYGHRALNVLQEWNYSNFYVGMAHRTLGELNILIDQFAKAVYHITMAEQMYVQMGSLYQLAKTWHCWAALHLARGDTPTALKDLKKAEEKFAE